MRWAEGFIAVDWGTTNRRAYRLDSSGKCAAEFEDDKGVLSVPKDGFPDAISDIRQRLGDYPLLLAGMVGSNRGWKEAPYVSCPAGIDDLAAKPLLLVANEFLDALPVRQHVDGIERKVIVVAGGLAFDRDGDIVETSAAREQAARSVAEHLVKHGGAAIFIDYGHERSGHGDTLQAMRSHRFAPVLSDPGEQDLTSHVDFEAVVKAVREAGADVILCCKGIVGRSGNTIVSTADISAYIPELGLDDSEATFAEDTIQTGGSIADERLGPLRVGGCEEDAHVPALRMAEERSPLGADGVHDSAHVVNALLERR